MMKFSIPQKFRLGTLLYNKKFTIPLSIVLAFALWLGIAMTENPVRDQTFNDLSASVTLEGTAAEALGLGIVSDVSSQKFSITVTGPNYIVSSLKAEDFTLSASTVEINAAGNFKLKLTATSTSNKTGYSVTSINPSTIDVSVDFFDSKDFTVVPKLIGVEASDGLVVDTPILSDAQHNTINIRGPRSEMSKIASVGAVAEVNSVLSTTETFTSDIVLYDKDNKVLYRFTNNGTVYDGKDNVITNSVLTPSIKGTNVTQPISKKKVVKCKVVFNNLPKGLSDKDINYTLSTNGVETNEVTIIGTPEIIDQIDNVALSTIDFRTVSTSASSFEVSPESLPNGVRFVDSTIEFFTVDIDLDNYSEKTFEITNIKSVNLGNNLKSKTDKSIQIRVCAPKNIISKIKTKDLYVVFDLKDKTAGTYTVGAELKSDVYNNIWQIGTYDRSVTIY